MTRLSLVVLVWIVLGASGCGPSTPAEFVGVCHGRGYAALDCRAYGSSATCGLVEGCHWTSAGSFCNGQPVPCQATHDETGCVQAYDCDWFGRPTCTTWSECTVAWLVDGNGCATVNHAYVFVGPSNEEVVVADHCH